MLQLLPVPDFTVDDKPEDTIFLFIEFIVARFIYYIQRYQEAAGYSDREPRILIMM